MEEAYSWRAHRIEEAAGMIGVFEDHTLDLELVGVLTSGVSYFLVRCPIVLFDQKEYYLAWSKAFLEVGEED